MKGIKKKRKLSFRRRRNRERRNEKDQDQDERAEYPPKKKQRMEVELVEKGEKIMWIKEMFEAFETKREKEKDDEVIVNN